METRRGRGQRRETLRQAGDRTGPRSVGATTKYGYKGQLLISTRCGGIYSIVHVTGMPMGLYTGAPSIPGGVRQKLID